MIAEDVVDEIVELIDLAKFPGFKVLFDDPFGFSLITIAGGDRQTWRVNVEETGT